MPNESAANRRQRAEEIRDAQARKERRRRMILPGIVIAIIVIFAVGAVVVQSQRDTTGNKPNAVPQSAAGSYSLAVGKKSAPVHVVVYEDFLCPFCRQFEEGSRDFLHTDAAQGKVYVEYRPIAFLNEYSGRSLNAFAAVLDAAGPKTALKYHDLLYDKQPAESGAMPADSFLVDLAVRAGAGRSKVESAITTMKFKDWITNANDAASKDKVQATPTVLVDGTQLEGQTIDDMVSNLETLIAKG